MPVQILTVKDLQKKNCKNPTSCFCLMSVNLLNLLMPALPVVC